ncbi:MAG: hypothetical protein WCE62_01480 [Polyangiales bacterium]
MPIQGELTVGGGKAALGFDAGYIVVSSDAHEWYAALYANWAATARLNLLGEPCNLMFGASRVNVRAYLGTQHTFGARLEPWRQAR